MNITKKIAAIFALLGALVFAPTALVAQEISPEHLALAQKYVAMTDTGAIYQRTIVITAQQSVDHLVQQNPEIGESILVAAREVATEYLKGDNLMHENYARIYATLFSVEELSEIIAFYETEVGQKILKNNIAINQNLQTAAKLLESNLETEFAAKLRTNLKGKGFDL